MEKLTKKDFRLASIALFNIGFSSPKDLKYFCDKYFGNTLYKFIKAERYVDGYLEYTLIEILDLMATQYNQAYSEYKKFIAKQ